MKVMEFIRYLSLPVYEIELLKDPEKGVFVRLIEFFDLFSD
jgi:hypothetical protein